MIATNNFLQYFPQLNNENLSKNFHSTPQDEATKIQTRIEMTRQRMQIRKCSEENYNLVDRSRPLLLCDRKKIISLYKEGKRKISIAREIGITHSCVSKVIRRFEETGDLENKNSRTASCACPGEAETHDLRICRHVRFHRMRKEQMEQMINNKKQQNDSQQKQQQYYQQIVHLQKQFLQQQTNGQTKIIE
uniref:Paired domain-containing protein n=1 Tax=Meloidogyne hapla TaxID=6305 RepID=A0A1I8AY35_MELHA